MFINITPYSQLSEITNTGNTYPGSLTWSMAIPGNRYIVLFVLNILVDDTSIDISIRLKILIRLISSIITSIS